MPICDASVSSSNCCDGSGHASMGAWVMSWMIASCVSHCSFPQTNGVSLFVSFVSGSASIEKFLQNM